MTVYCATSTKSTSTDRPLPPHNGDDDLYREDIDEPWEFYTGMLTTFDGVPDWVRAGTLTNLEDTTINTKPSLKKLCILRLLTNFAFSQHPTSENQIYRWFPRVRKTDALYWGNISSLLPEITEGIKEAQNIFTSTEICETPANPDFTGKNPSYAFEPMGYRVSKVIFCKNGFTVRLANYQSWYTAYNHETSNAVRIRCYDALEHAWTIIRAISVDLKFYEWTYLQNVIWGRFHAQVLFPRRAYEADGAYRLLGMSWWGGDWSSAIIIGWEGPEGKFRGPDLPKKCLPYDETQMVHRYEP